VVLKGYAGIGPDGQACYKASFSAETLGNEISAIQQIIPGLTIGSTYQASIWVQGVSG
jgi:hypothetical protein